MRTFAETAVIVAIVTLIGVIFTSFLGPYLLKRFDPRKPEPPYTPATRRKPRSAVK